MGWNDEMIKKEEGKWEWGIGKAKEEENAYEVIIVYLPDNDIQETTLEVYLERT